MNSCPIVAFFVVYTVAFLTGLFSAASMAAGPEVVEVINVQNQYVADCPTSAPQGVSCNRVLKYKTTFKRKNGTSGSVLLSSRTTSKYLVISFCPAQQGQLEEPCPQTP